MTTPSMRRGSRRSPRSRSERSRARSCASIGRCARWSRSRTGRLPRALIAILVLALLAACERTNGTGKVAGDFFVKECRPLGDRPLEPYSFNAGAMSTQRNFDVLLILIQDHMV